MMIESQNSNVPTLPVLVDRWGQVVEEIERGYSLTYDDYLNDVDLRQLIARAFRGIAPAVREQFAELKEALYAMDRRFMDATDATQHCVWGDAIAEDEGWSRDSEWWFYRQPKQLPADW